MIRTYRVHWVDSKGEHHRETRTGTVNEIRDFIDTLADAVRVWCAS